MTLTLNFQGQIWNCLYLSQKWPDFHETKSKHIDWSQDLKYDHQVWPWPWPWPWIFKVKYGIGYISAKNGRIATKRKANTLTDLKTSNMTIRFDLGHDLDLEFSRSNMKLAISLPKMVWLPRNEKRTHRLNSRPQMWPSDLTLAMTLTLNFQGQIWNLLYLSQKWSDCHEMKSEHIDWTLGLKCDHQIWPWPWPWLWIFKVKYEICYISTKSGLIAMRRKANIPIWTLGLKCHNGFDLGHDLDISIFKVICGLDHLVTKVRCKYLPDSDRGDFSCRRAVDSSSF